MKATLVEEAGCFGINFLPETMADAALLVRFGTNATNEIRSLATCANGDGTFNTFIVFGKHRKANFAVPRRGERR
jgi:hypothetical protein